MKYAVDFYTLSDGHVNKEMEAPNRAALMQKLTAEMIDLSAPLTIYETGENKPMTTPAQPTPAEVFRAEITKILTDQNKVILSLRQELDEQYHELREAITEIRDGLRHAATPAPTPAGMTETFQAAKITRSRSNGKDYYKILGGRYVKNGVTIWKEGLEAIGIDPLTIQWNADDSHDFKPPFNVIALLKTYTDENGEEKITPQKVIGKA